LTKKKKNKKKERNFI